MVRQLKSTLFPPPSSPSSSSSLLSLFFFKIQQSQELTKKIVPGVSGSSAERHDDVAAISTLPAVPSSRTK